jgi:hypothetical protein
LSTVKFFLITQLFMPFKKNLTSKCLNESSFTKYTQILVPQYENSLHASYP